MSWIKKFHQWCTPSKSKLTNMYFLYLMGVFFWPSALLSFILSYCIYKKARNTWAESYCLELIKLFFINSLYLVINIGFMISVSYLAYYWENRFCYIAGIVIGLFALFALWTWTLFNYMKNIKYIHY